jgi:hypothetical protein
VVPGPDEEGIADDDPAAVLLPARLEHVRAWQVAPRDGYLGVGGADAEAAGVAVEDGPEHAGAVHAREAQPLDVAARRDQRRGLAVRQEAVVGDRRERAAPEGEALDREIGQLVHRDRKYRAQRTARRAIVVSDW